LAGETTLSNSIVKQQEARKIKSELQNKKRATSQIFALATSWTEDLEANQWSSSDSNAARASETLVPDKGQATRTWADVGVAVALLNVMIE